MIGPAVFRRLWRSPRFRPDDYRLVSEFIDHKYYLTMYSDVAQKKVDPVAHYLNHGWREGRNPNPWFVTEFYLKQNPDVWDAGINPFVHYLRYGRNEGRASAPARLERPVSLATLIAGPRKKDHRRDSEASIVVPVYDAFDDLGALLANLEDTVDAGVRIIFVDDCSPDERIVPLLREWSARHDSWTAVSNDQNRGFAASVNRGIELSTGHVVILNTDVLLPRNWLALLLAPIWEDEESVASVTPFSNSSSLTGFPLLRQESALPCGESLDDLADAFASMPSLGIDIVSGVGFCMAMSRKALDRIGPFDAETYRDGYYEDTDWCQRALHAGFRNVAVSNLFVYHKVGSGSYGVERRNTYSERNRRQFLKKFPYYMNAEQAFLQHDPLSETRTLAQAMLWRRRGRAAVLIIDHVWGGGANLFSNRLRRRLLAEGTFVVTLGIIQTMIELRFSFQSEELKYQEHFDSHVWRLTDLFEFDEIIVNGIHGANRVTELLAELVKLSTTSRLIFYVHDYMCVCPSIFLLNGADSYCRVPDIRVCYECMLSNKHIKFGAVNQTEWRRAWGKFLARAQEIRVFSESSREILSKAYPDLAAGSRLAIVDPQYEPGLGAVEVRPPGAHSYMTGFLGRRKARRLRVGVMGSLYVHKGSRVVSELARYIETEAVPLDITLFGQWQDGKPPKNLDHAGPYSVEAIASLISQKGVSVMLFPSVCPETYSYTLSEIFRMDLPVVALRVGAQAERVGQYRWGILVDDLSPARLCEALYQADELRRTQSGNAAGSTKIAPLASLGGLN